jgi:hypothetical protein
LPVKCFMVHETNRFRLSMRRYAHVSACPGKWGYHHAQSKVFETVEISKGEDGYYLLGQLDGRWPKSDPRWPHACKCGYAFSDADARQVFQDHVYVDDAGVEYSSRKMPPGAMHFVDYVGDSFKGPDGHALQVVCPDGQPWIIDGPASNCTLPKDRGPFDRAHRCWVRHGTPPLITVDKSGKTCSAGGGSIQTKGYHGFLRAGVFT